MRKAAVSSFPVGRTFLLPAGLAFLFLTGTAFAQKKPITLDALQSWRNNAAHNAPGDPVWAPDGKTFVYRQGSQLKWFDVAAKKSYGVVDLTALDNAALSPSAPERYEWENRRVDEASLQWSPRGREVLYAGGGDLFLITIPGGEWRQLVKTPTAEQDPKFSPDGKRVAFRRGWDLYVLNLADGRETRPHFRWLRHAAQWGARLGVSRGAGVRNGLLVGARFERHRVSAI